MKTAKKVPSSAKSKSTFGRPAIPAGAQKGQLVFLKHEGDKTARRELYLVTDVNETNDCVTVCKLKNSMSTESASFRPNHYLLLCSRSATTSFVHPLFSISITLWAQGISFAYYFTSLPDISWAHWSPITSLSIVQHSYICVLDTFHIIGQASLVWFGNSRNGGFSLEEPRPIVLA